MVLENEISTLLGSTDTQELIPHWCKVFFLAVLKKSCATNLFISKISLYQIPDLLALDRSVLQCVAVTFSI